MKRAHGWQLGRTSERYESGGRGPGTVSSGADDPGGVSYGTYQLSSKAGTLREYLDQSTYQKHFDGLAPGTPSFNNKWKELAQNETGFGLDQHRFIKATHYDVQANRLKAMGLDLTNFGPAVQDALWSTSVQYRNLTRDIVDNGLRTKFGDNYQLTSLSDHDIVEAIQDYKVIHNDRLFSKAPPWIRRSILGRIESERMDLKDLVDEGAHTAGTHLTTPHADKATMRFGARGPEVSDLQADLAALGYSNPDGGPLQADGHYGRLTVAAVKDFQIDNGLTSDGIAGEHTFSEMQRQRSLHYDTPALIAELDGPPAVRFNGLAPTNRAPMLSTPYEPAVLETTSPSVNPFANPNHQAHGIYSELKERIPNASENRLAEMTAACRMAGIEPGCLGDIYIGKDEILLLPDGPGMRAVVNNARPAPPFEQSAQEVEAFDLQQATMTAQLAPQREGQQMNGPGGPRVA